MIKLMLKFALQRLVAFLGRKISNTEILALLVAVVSIIEKIIDVLTDDDKDNSTQVKQVISSELDTLGKKLDNVLSQKPPTIQQ